MVKIFVTVFVRKINKCLARKFAILKGKKCNDLKILKLSTGNLYT